MGKNSAISDCFQPSILFLFYPCSRLFTCDCLFYFHLHARPFFILYPYGASNVGFMGRADGQWRDTVTTHKYIIEATWGTAKVSALPSEEWVQQDNLVIPGYLQVVLKSFCWAVLLSCLDSLTEEKYEARGWHSYHLSDFCVWFLETGELKFVLWSIQFMVPVYLQCCKASYIYFHHRHRRAMKCAMYGLFHRLKGKVVTFLFFFLMILFWVL